MKIHWKTVISILMLFVTIYLLPDSVDFTSYDAVMGGFVIALIDAHFYPEDK